jgi:hypothetical protein
MLVSGVVVAGRHAHGCDDTRNTGSGNAAGS